MPETMPVPKVSIVGDEAKDGRGRDGEGDVQRAADAAVEGEEALRPARRILLVPAAAARRFALVGSDATEAAVGALAARRKPRAVCGVACGC